MAFSLAGSLDSTSVVLIDMDIAFATDGNKIHLPITSFLLCAAAGNLVCLEKQRYWTLHNAVLLPSFLTEAAILNRGSDAGELLNIFSHSVAERAD